MKLKYLKTFESYNGKQLYQVKIRTYGAAYAMDLYDLEIDDPENEDDVISAIEAKGFTYNPDHDNGVSGEVAEFWDVKPQ